MKHSIFTDIRLRNPPYKNFTIGFDNILIQLNRKKWPLINYYRFTLKIAHNNLKWIDNWTAVVCCYETYCCGLQLQ